MLLRNLPRQHMPYLVFLLALSTTISAFRPPTSQQSAYHHSVQMSQFDEAAYESNRLTQDAIAMDTMKRRAENEYEKLRTPWKWRIRKAVWDYLEAENIAVFPRPVHHRIPNFQGADAAAQKLATLPEFQNANLIKVNPDTPQRQVRHFVLEEGKTLLTPQPRLRTGFFSTLSRENVLPDVPVEALTTSKGAAQYGTPVSLYESYTVDLVVVGSTAVCPRTGARVGKGEGFAELEWGILTQQNNLDPEKVLVVTSVHDCQVFDSEKEPWKSLLREMNQTEDTTTPFGTLTQHDVPVDIIVTPTRIIHVSDRLPKPSGVYWNLLSPQKLSQIRVLQELKRRIEEESGEKLPSGPDEVLPPIAERGRGRGRGGRRGRGWTGGGRGRGGGRSPRNSN